MQIIINVLDSEKKSKYYWQQFSGNNYSDFISDDTECIAVGSGQMQDWYRMSLICWDLSLEKCNLNIDSKSKFTFISGFAIITFLLRIMIITAAEEYESNETNSKSE